MINEELLFEKKSIHSDKLKKDIELEVYDKGEGGKKIIRTLSLIEVFEGVRDSFGTTLKKEVSSISFDRDGNPVYCLAEVKIEDTTGFNEIFYGESLPSTRKNIVSSEYPFNTALNRAIGKGLRRYLGLPSELYSSAEIPVDSGQSNDESTDIKNLIKTLGEKAEAEAEKAVEDPKPVIPPSIEEAPIESVPEAAKEDEAAAPITAAPIESAPEVPTETEPEAPAPAEPVKEDTPAEPAPVEEPKAEADTKAEAPASNPATTASEKVLRAINVVDKAYGSVIVTFGPGKGKTVAEVVADPACKRFVENITSGKAVMPVDNPEKAKVFRAIKEYAEDTTFESAADDRIPF